MSSPSRGAAHYRYFGSRSRDTSNRGWHRPNTGAALSSAHWLSVNVSPFLYPLEWHGFLSATLHLQK